ncbi:hypothetical protein PHMEG_00015992 [Phytophthora megakarya]|uniref:Uncharacterized protein n=1 Tax=Phytophthora megakarya TaxID=4795 RepID=A0A225W0D2_9STRA|nr:hypothetical protein PHMEG_00015992 [Phytophthora megakarya]
MANAGYGSADKLDCDKCDRVILHSNFTKHKKKCKGIRVHEFRSAIPKRSWVKHRTKRVGDQRSRRTTQSFKRLQGIEGHPREHLGHHATLLAYIYDQVYLLLDSDKRRHMPAQFQEESVWNLLEETCKAFSTNKDTVLNEDGNTVFG